MPDPKKQKNNKATRADSLAVYNNSKKVDTYYKNNKDYESVAFPDPVTHLKNKKAVDNYTRTNSKSINGSFVQNHIGVALEDYYKKIDNNKYLQREAANAWLNMDAPMQLFDKRIKAREATGYRSENGTDFVNIANYNNIGNKPFDLLTEKEKVERVKLYGTDGVPKSYLNKIKPTTTVKPSTKKPIVDPKKKPIVNPTKLNVEGLQPMSVGLQDINNGFETNLDIPTPIQRQPKYYNVRDVNNQTFGGTDTQYRVNGLDELRELPKEQWTRTTTPHYSLGGNIKNMKRYAEGGALNQFNVGGTHEQNPNGGIPQGPNAMVEQGETSTKTPNGKYIYSDRLYINEDLVKQFNLPNSIKGKTFADASKVIDKPFKDKNSNPDKMTHKEHLDRLKQAQETLKAEEAQKERAIMQNAQQSPGFENQQIPEGMEDFTGQQEMPQDEMPQEGMEQAIPQSGMSAYGGFIKRYDKGGMVDFLDENQGMFGTVDGIGKQLQSNRVAQPGDRGSDTAKNMTTAALNAFIPGAGTAAGAADSLITGIAGNSKVGKGIASMVSPLGTIKGIGSALETGNISDMPMVGMFTGNSTFEKQKVKQARSSATSANNAFSDKFAEGGELEFTVSNPNNVAPMNYAPVNYVTTPTDSGQNIRFNSSGYSPLEMRNDKFIQEAGTVLRKDANGNILTMPQLRENQKMYNYTKNAPDRYYVNKWLRENPGKTEEQYSKAIEKLEKAKDVGQQGLNDGYSKAGKACRTETSSSTKDIKAEGGYMNYFKTGGFMSNYRSTREDDPSYKFQNKSDSLDSENSDNWLERNGGKMLKYAPIAMNAYQLSQLKKPSGVVLDRLSNRYKPMYMDENRIQNQVSNEMNNSVAGLTNATAGSESALRANLVGTTAGRIKGMSDAYSKMNEYNAGQNLAGQQFNLGVDQANIGQSNNQLEINDRNQANYRNQRSKLLGSIGTDLGSVGKEEVNKNSLAEALGYTVDGDYVVNKKTGEKSSADSWFKRLFSKNAYGGFITTNKIGRK